MNLPEAARDWLRENRLTYDVLEKYSVQWSEETQALWFPIYHNGMLFAQQERMFDGGKKKKWMTTGPIHEYPVVLEGAVPHLWDDGIVIVEDIVSAIRVAEAGVSAMPIFGSKIMAKHLDHLLAADLSPIFVWLDWDMRMYALGQQARIKTVTNEATVVIVGTQDDPKAHSNDELVTILRQEWIKCKTK